MLLAVTSFLELRIDFKKKLRCLKYAVMVSSFIYLCKILSSCMFLRYMCPSSSPFCNLMSLQSIHFPLFKVSAAQFNIQNFIPISLLHICILNQPIPFMLSFCEQFLITHEVNVVETWSILSQFIVCIDYVFDYRKWD